MIYTQSSNEFAFSFWNMNDYAYRIEKCTLSFLSPLKIVKLPVSISPCLVYLLT